MKVLRPQDIYVLLAIIAHNKHTKWTYDQLADRLKMSASQVFRSLQRAESSHLFDKRARRIHQQELCEFLIHGIRYIFPANIGEIDYGISTCWGMPELSEVLLLSAGDSFIWTTPCSATSGQTVEPLHPYAPTAARKDENLYRLLAMTDIFRVGTQRERKIAGEELEGHLFGR